MFVFFSPIEDIIEGEIKHPFKLRVSHSKGVIIYWAPFSHPSPHLLEGEMRKYYLLQSVGGEGWQKDLERKVEGDAAAAELLKSKL